VNFLTKNSKISGSEKFTANEEEAAKSGYEDQNYKNYQIELNGGETLKCRALPAYLVDSKGNVQNFVEQKACYALRDYKRKGIRYYSERNSLNKLGASLPQDAFGYVWSTYGKDSMELREFQSVLDRKHGRYYYLQVIESDIELYPVGGVFRFVCPKNTTNNFWLSQILQKAVKFQKYNPFTSMEVHPIELSCKTLLLDGKERRDFSDSDIRLDLDKIGFLMSKEIVEAAGGKFKPYKDSNKVVHENLMNVVLPTLRDEDGEVVLDENGDSTLDAEQWMIDAYNAFVSSYKENENITLVPTNDAETEKYVEELCASITDGSFFSDDAEEVDSNGTSQFIGTETTPPSETPQSSSKEVEDDLPF